MWVGEPEVHGPRPRLCPATVARHCANNVQATCRSLHGVGCPPRHPPVPWRELRNAGGSAKARKGTAGSRLPERYPVSVGPQGSDMAKKLKRRRYLAESGYPDASRAVSVEVGLAQDERRLERLHTHRGSNEAARSPARMACGRTRLNMVSDRRAHHGIRHDENDQEDRKQNWRVVPVPV